MKKSMRPRPAACVFDGGLSDRSTFDEFQEVRQSYFSKIADSWNAEGGTLLENKYNMPKVAGDWVRDMLEPWCKDVEPRLALYAQWLQNGSSFLFLEQALARMLPSMDFTVPKLFEVCLGALRNIEKSGEWPGTTIGRRTVIVDAEKSFKEVMGERDTMKSTKTKEKKSVEGSLEGRAFVNGSGDKKASGSFSIGLMPTDSGGSATPASNAKFPELVKAAFLLEQAMFPDRRPSSTIAVNRNAQFRPHTDSGAGAGQSLSLIVALGDFVGGELMVEGVEKDIRYKGVEFDGWRERHWTMPFAGERFSLVWFTPKGCEGMFGLSL